MGHQKMASNTANNSQRLQNPQPHPPSAARLSCEACTQRKVKCDRLIPCTRCRNSGILCVPVERRRFPRGRSAKPNARKTRISNRRRELYDRLSRLEELVKGIAQSAEIDSFGMWSNEQIADDNPPDIGGVSLTADGLYEDSSYGDLAAHAPSSKPQSLVPLNRRDPPSYGVSPLLSTGVISIEHIFSSSSFQRPFHELQICQRLFQIYLAQVDPVIKILHRPSLHGYLSEGKRYLSYENSHPAPAALASAIYYAAICSLTQDQSLLIFGMGKNHLVSRYQREADAALERANFILTDDITVLQAFVISIIASRSHDRSPRLWTMFGMAFRIAQALSLHMPNPPFQVKPFEREMRRRLWHAIGWLDIQASLNNATEPMIQVKWLQCQPYLNINDHEFACDGNVKISPHHQVTETTLFQVMSYAQDVARLLDLSEVTGSGMRDAHQRQQVVFLFHQQTAELLVGVQPDQIDFHWYLKEVTYSIEVFLSVLALRPLQKHPDFISWVPSTQILTLAIEALASRERVYTSPRSNAWCWVGSFFFPWQALLVALAEICSCQDFLLIQTVWPLIERSYERFTALFVDPPQTLLSKAMERMMEQARGIHDSILGCSAAEWTGQLLQDAPRGQVWPLDYSRLDIELHNPPHSWDQDQAICDEPTTNTMSLARGNVFAFPESGTLKPDGRYSDLTGIFAECT
ncbi:hypothetical protein BO71DRAFT_367596 [Aspergillus ellipticus CBS 707.79]|uniref:Zn(2)-C6 fungal-type domain-containing protein n=1 Tax=Aspergillus ellipticus CBS 707.79 TaxID=1448320 RepID=A0A319DQY4_9EURO|nr:hypothetical protein BO71DRAFT_367596 [Aspergillus ellipticus CBS 707.79]